MEHTSEKITTINKEDVFSLTFINNNNYKINFYNFGGYIHQIHIPYQSNKERTEDVLLGYNDFDDCKISRGYFNSIIGRVGNRIGNAKFNLNNKEYNLFKNVPPNHLHGGEEGFNKKIWKILKIEENSNFLSCTMEYVSPHLEENYPGNLDCKAKFTLNNNNEFIISFCAKTDEDTIVNLTNHNYWNFHGHKNNYQNIVNHNVYIEADHICEIDESYIPTGKIVSVKDTKFDLNNTFHISQNFLDEEGIDHNYVLKNANLVKADGIIFSTLTGMGVEYFTDQPGMQFYTGNMMDENYEGKYYKTYGKNHGMCFEPQIFPDAINHSNFPSPMLNAGDTYRSTIKMKFRNNFI